MIRILRRGDSGSLTTNRIAEIAGVSIGSVYQYFPDKRAIFIALHQRHIAEIDRIIGAVLVQNASAPLAGLVRNLVEAMVDAHTGDTELYQLLSTQIPQKPDGAMAFSTRLHGAFRLALAAHTHELRPGLPLDLAVFVVTHIVDSLCHGAALRRPAGIGLAAAKEESVRAVLSYLRDAQSRAAMSAH